MDIVKSFYGRNVRLDIVRDSCASHPAEMTDAPVHYGTWTPGHSIAPRGKDEGKPDVRKGRAIVYLNVSDYDTSLSDRKNANAAVWMDFDEETIYGGNPNLSMRLLRRFTISAAREAVAWANGDVYGYEVFDTFKRYGETYTVEDSVDSCWGFYGPEGLAGIAGYAPTKAMKRAIRAFARSEGYNGR